MADSGRIDLAERIRIGDAQADFTRFRIEGPNGEVSVEPKVMDVLKVLVDRRGEPVPRDDLIEAVWTGKFGGEERLSRAISLLRKALGDVQGHHAHIETVPRLGYRLIAEVEPIVRQHTTIGGARPRWTSQRVATIAAVVTLALVAMLVWMRSANPAGEVVRDFNTTTTADTIRANSIAVLPFADLSPAGNQRYFSDGLAEEILDALANVEGLNVVGRTSSFAYRDTPADVRDIGEALGVGFLLEGSVRKQDDRLRVTAQLIRTDDGFHAWSRTYDGDVSDIFDFQEDVARSIALAMTPESGTGEARLAPEITSNREAYDLYLQGREMSRRFGTENKQAAVRLLQQATDLDPDFAEAWGWLARSHYFVPIGLPNEDPTPSMEAAREAAAQALIADPKLAMGHYVSALLNGEERHLADAVTAMERAYAAAPKTPFFTIRRGYHLAMIGQVERGAELMEAGLTLDPTDAPGLTNLAAAKIHLGEIEEGLRLFERANTLGFDPAAINNCIYRGALGQPDEGFACFTEIPKNIRTRYPSSVRSDEAWEDLGRAMVLKDGAAKARVLPGILDALDSGQHPANVYSLGVLLNLGEIDLFMGYFYQQRSPNNSSVLFYTWMNIPGRPAFFEHPRFPEFAERVGLLDAWWVHGWPDDCSPLQANDPSGAEFTCTSD